jgi:hypothetical protein
MDRRLFIKLAGGTLAYMAGGALLYGTELPEQLKDSLAAKLACATIPTQC